MEEKKYYLTKAQSDLVSRMQDYESAKVKVTKRFGNELILNGMAYDLIDTSTMKALLKKGYLKRVSTSILVYTGKIYEVNGTGTKTLQARV